MFSLKDWLVLAILLAIGVAGYGGDLLAYLITLILVVAWLGACKL